ncbi:hypothetical protein D3C72_652370 [compost metagenome]
MNKFFKMALLAMPLGIGAGAAQAQTFVAPNAYEHVFNGNIVSQSDEASCYSFRNVYGTTAWGDVDVYLAGWGIGLSEFTVQFTKPSDPSNVVYHETFRYDDASSFQVGAVYNAATGNTQILVAYEWAGYKIDVYDITSSPTNPVVYNTTIPITSTLGYFGHRIRLDAQSTDLRKAAVVYEDPYSPTGGGIFAKACLDGNWGNAVFLNGSNGEIGPDLALTEIGGNTYVRFVHQNAAGTQINSSIIDFNAIYYGTGSVTPFFADVYNPPAGIGSKIVLDCKDADDSKNWAYTFADQTHDNVIVRYDYYGTTGDVSVNSGALGNTPLSGYNVYSPTLHYGGGHSGNDDITVGWYATNGSYNGYLGLEMKPDASGLVGFGDYWELPNGTTPAPYSNLPNTGIAFSKSDIDLTPDFMYAVYYNRDASSTYLDELHHAFHKWGDVVFKNNVTLDLETNAVYPNPFSDILSTSVTLKESGTVRLELADITGRTVAQQETKADKGTWPMQLSGLQHVIAGTYFLNTMVDGQRVNTRTVIKK